MTLFPPDYGYPNNHWCIHTRRPLWEGNVPPNAVPDASRVVQQSSVSISNRGCWNGKGSLSRTSLAFHLEDSSSVQENGACPNILQPGRGQSKPDDRSGPQNFPVDHAVGLLAPAHQSGENPPWHELHDALGDHSNIEPMIINNPNPPPRPIALRHRMPGRSCESTAEASALQTPAQARLA